MMMVTRKGRVMGGVHKLWLKREADEMGLVYHDRWRDCKLGEWALSDDGYVVQCLRYNEYFDKVWTRMSGRDEWTGWYDFSCSRVTSRSKVFLATRGLRAPRGINGKRWDESMVTSKKGKIFLQCYVRMVLSRNFDYVLLAQILYGNGEVRYVRKVLRNKLVQSAIYDTMSDYLRESGVNADDVLKDYIKVKDEAIKDGKYGDAIKILEKFERWTGLNDKITGDAITDKGLENTQIDSRMAKLLEERKQPLKSLDGRQYEEVSRGVEVHDSEGKLISKVMVDDEAMEDEND